VSCFEARLRFILSREFPNAAGKKGIEITTAEDHWRSFSECFDRALDLPECERAAWLATLALTDPGLAREVADVLAQRERLGYGDFLAAPLLDVGKHFEEATLSGRHVGPYVVESELGRGGMGSVWRARRVDERFENTVAIKFLHASWIGLQGEQRFRAEGQILGRLDHPNIARLIDAGLLDATHPYLVLEFVEGEGIDAYCRRLQLTLDARIDLFLEVLAAVAHAHSHLIVHRDIKPANIFVTRNGSVKLLDFGIAKLLDAAPGSIASTHSGATALTPQFAAPEQLLGQSVTTATDVYSLGLVLYVLLTGRHPIGSDSASHAQLLQAALTEDAPCASSIGEVAAVPRRSLEGDLDNILAKAMKKAPAERYASVGEFAEDLRRYLLHEPVKARADTVTYRLTKFVRRHRGGVLSSVLTLLILCAATVVTFMQKMAADRQRDAAEFEARRAESSNEFLNLLMLSDSSSAISPAARLDLGARMLELQYRDDPRFAGRMLVQLSSQYRGQTATKQALALAARAYELGKGVGDFELMALAQCTAAYAEATSGLAAGAAQRVVEARKLMEELSAPPVSLQVDCDRADAQTAHRQGNFKSAEDTLEDARRLLETSKKTYLSAYTSVLSDLGGIYNDTARPQQALAMTQLIGATHEQYGRGGTGARLMAMQNEAAVLVNIGERQAALRTADEVRKRRFAIDGDAPEPLSMTVNYASNLVMLGRQQEGISQARGAFTRAQASGNTYWMLFALVAECLGEIDSAQLPRAEAALEQLAAGIDKGSASDSHFAGLVDRLRGQLQLRRGEAEAALQSAEASLTANRETKNGRDARASLNLAARASLALGQPEDAEKFASQALHLAEAVARGPDSSADVGEALLLVAKANIAEGRAAQAQPLLERAVRCLTNGLGDAHPRTEEAIQLAQVGAR
jgi:serine/threonine protein kinase